MSWIYDTYQRAQCADLTRRELLCTPTQLDTLEFRIFRTLNIRGRAIAHVQDGLGRQTKLPSGLLKYDPGRFAKADVAGNDYGFEVFIEAKLAQQGFEARVPIRNDSQPKLVSRQCFESGKDIIKNAPRLRATKLRIKL